MPRQERTDARRRRVVRAGSYRVSAGQQTRDRGYGWRGWSSRQVTTDHLEEFPVDRPRLPCGWRRDARAGAPVHARQARRGLGDVAGTAHAPARQAPRPPHIRMGADYRDDLRGGH